jgi:hypothetical protein
VDQLVSFFRADAASWAEAFSFLGVGDPRAADAMLADTLIDSGWAAFQSELEPDPETLAKARAGAAASGAGRWMELSKPSFECPFLA